MEDRFLDMPGEDEVQEEEEEVIAEEGGATTNNKTLKWVSVIFKVFDNLTRNLHYDIDFPRKVC